MALVGCIHLTVKNREVFRRTLTNSTRHGYTKLQERIEQLLECIDVRQGQRDEAKKISVSMDDPAEGVRKMKINTVLKALLSDQRGQDIAEYGVILAVILVLVVGTVRLVGSNTNHTFSSVASSVQ
jgi:Flp pilus assembly pilin Flp